MFDLLLEGEDFPEKIYIVSRRGKFLLTKISKNHFKGKLTRLTEPETFYFEANGFNSPPYKVNVLAKTAIGKLEAKIDYPDYLEIEDEIIENPAQLSIYEGSKVDFSVLTKNTSKVDFLAGNIKKTFHQKGFKVKHQFFTDEKVKFILYNKESGKKDTVLIDINIKKDEYPSIFVSERKDSIREKIRFFSGEISDDNGLTALLFVYEIKRKGEKPIRKTINVTSVSGTQMPFDFAVDFAKEDLRLNDEVTYYFEVYDNDAVNRKKHTRSRVFVLKIPSLEQLNEKRDEDWKETMKELEETFQRAKEFNKDVERLKKSLLNQKSSSWNDKQQVQELKEEYNSLKQDIEAIKNKMEESVEEKNRLSEIDKELLEKQEQIQNLLEELMDDEIKKLLEELEKLMNQQRKDELNESVEELEESAEDMEKRLDRTMEMLKRLQVNEKIDEIEEELKKLSKEQLELKKETEGKKKPSIEDLKKQQDINDKFKQLKEDMNEMLKLNKELERPLDINSFEKETQNIENELNNSKNNLEKGKTKKAGGSQQKAAEEMKKMAEMLNQQQEQSNEEAAGEDMELLRAILEQLIYLSFEQEDVMVDFFNVSDDDPKFKELSFHQRKLIDLTKVVDDSLNALARRQPKIASFIDQELNQIRKNHELIIEDIDERRRKQLSIHQQFVMTSLNNLALMLNESLASMQASMRQKSKPGQGSCSKPGGGGKPIPKSGKMGIKDMKQMLKQQLDAMKKGKSPGKKNEGGKKPGGKSVLSSEQIAKMAAQQAMIRRRLEQLKKELNKEGKGKGNKLTPLIDELKKQEEDLINKRIDNNLIERQQEILTRLLESEKAIKERGLDKKRESKTGKNQNYSNQIRFDQYNKEKLKQIELLRSITPELKKYYRDKLNEYYNSVL